MDDAKVHDDSEGSLTGGGSLATSQREEELETAGNTSGKNIGDVDNDICEDGGDNDDDAGCRENGANVGAGRMECGNEDIDMDLSCSDVDEGSRESSKTVGRRMTPPAAEIETIDAPPLIEQAPQKPVPTIASVPSQDDDGRLTADDSPVPKEESLAPSNEKESFRNATAPVSVFVDAEILPPSMRGSVILDDESENENENVACSADVDAADDARQAVSQNAPTQPGAVAVNGTPDQPIPSHPISDNDDNISAAIDTPTNIRMYTVDFDEEVQADRSGIMGANSQAIIEAVPVRAQADHPVAYAKAVRCFTFRNAMKIACMICAMIVILGIGITLGVMRESKQGATTAVPGGGNGPAPTDAPTTSSRPVLDVVRKRGRLICGVQENLLGFSMYNLESGREEGFEIDLCKAIAAGIFGKSEGHYDTLTVGSSERWTALVNSSVDIITRTTTHTMSRDVHQSSTMQGYSFSIPYLYDGLQFNGIPPYTQCADTLQLTGVCRGLKICTFENSTHFDMLSKMLPSSKLVVGSAGDRITDFINGKCNVIAGVSNEVSGHTIRLSGYEGPLEHGTKLFSKETLSMVTRENDPSWTSFTSAILLGLLKAVELNITQHSSTAFGTTDLFGNDFPRMFVDSIASVGNYDEICKRHLVPLAQSQAINGINDGSTGLIYSFPLGSVDDVGRSPSEESRLYLIQASKKLLCGISDETAPEMHKDFCRLIAAALFSDISEAVIAFVHFDDDEQLLDGLRNGMIDVAAGVPSSLETSVLFDVTFTQPYFYDKHSALALATSDDDPQFSDFCFWVVSAVFYAEETKTGSNDMPLVSSFGPRYERMFRDAVLFVGDYGDIYSRNENDLGRRRGRNLLNDGTPPDAQHVPLLWNASRLYINTTLGL